MKQPKMTANRIEVMIYVSVYTEESIENGDIDHSYCDNRQVFNDLETAAEYIAFEMMNHGIDALDSGDMFSMYGEMSDYGYDDKREEYSLHTRLGENLKKPEIKDKLESLVWSILVNQHRFDEQRAYRMIGYREPVQKMAVNQSYQGTESGFCGAAHPAMGFKLYLVK